ncbi:MAG: threonylcarbamoyl-AMP synthase [Betaproteobacteria bacterium]|nr:threonylcarbamoyl-AMP synthase [Betaproteobacteria bacterium]
MRAELIQAVSLLRAGELVAFPTETVYGLGADARNPAAVARIFAAKGRPADHPVIVHLPDATHLSGWARVVPQGAVKLARLFWPGPLTLVLRRSESVPDIVTGGQDTVGLRVPGHPLALELLQAFGSGIAAPSANRFGRISPTTAEHVRRELGRNVRLVLDGGPCPVGIESTILDLSGAVPRLLRPGAVTAAQLSSALGEPVTTEAGADASAPRVPGSLAAHYAPATPLHLVEPRELAAVVAAWLDRGGVVAVLARRPALDAHPRLHWQLAPADPGAYAHELYASLRAFDEGPATVILVEALPRELRWNAVADRLARAACGSGETDET